MHKHQLNKVTMVIIGFVNCNNLRQYPLSNINIFFIVHSINYD